MVDSGSVGAGSHETMWCVGVSASGGSGLL